MQLQLGEQTSDEHRARNPAGLVPVWRDPDGFTLSQSLAIIDYLDEIYPHPPLLPNELQAEGALSRDRLHDRLRHPSDRQFAGA